jgi:hypothetical protein
MQWRVSGLYTSASFFNVQNRRPLQLHDA